MNEKDKLNNAECNQDIFKRYTEKTAETSKASKKKTLIVYIIIIALAIIICFAPIVSFKINTKIEQSKERIVPNIEGKTFGEAKKELADLDLILKSNSGNPENDDAIIINQFNQYKMKKGDTVTVATKTQEEIEREKEEEKEKQQKATLKNKTADVGTTFTSFEQINKKGTSATKHILADIWNTYANIYPNAKWKEMEIKEGDGCGRYWVRVKYVKNILDTYYSTDHIIAWYVDDSHYGIIMTTGNIDMKKQQAKWGTELNINN